MLDQTVNEMQSDLIRMRQSSAQVDLLTQQQLQLQGLVCQGNLCILVVVLNQLHACAGACISKADRGQVQAGANDLGMPARAGTPTKECRTAGQASWLECGCRMSGCEERN